MTFTLPAMSNRDYALGLARAFGGAIIFGLPLLMTMEMWSLGLAIHPARLLIFVVLNFCVLVVLSRFGGFEPTDSIGEDLLDALGAYAVGIAASGLILGLFNLLYTSMPLGELAGMIAVQSIPTSFGAMLARKQLGDGEDDKSEEQKLRSDGYAGELFLMLAGSMFLAFNVAPTEEVILIGFKMTPWHSLTLIAASLFALHALVFAVGLPGQEQAPDGYGGMRLFIAYTVPGYAIAALVSLYILWTFGRVDGQALHAIAGSVVVLGFPASIGAAIARLVV
ncbi:TIGR02587 family membrane protein [Sphingobium sufflavum]|uniref:TIGR02587 family membrane protein n=1 Tax=Sphingobium sufflavum TaxID=1129547 RepID=UPI001F1AAD3A|nr:TIGR02587 family membrane protein [Sphingobium sufflavum]MCE7798108.1 TIGR02587 family membrane protein [Sphingobium sufflavum]